MPIFVKWDNGEQTRIRQDFVQQWDQTDFMAAADQIYDMMASVPHPVHVILDMRQSETNPLQVLNVFRTANKLEARVAPNHGTTVVVQAGLVVEMALGMTRHIARKATADVHTTHSIEEALAIINRAHD